MDLPGQLNFSMLTKGTAPPAEVVPVRNAGSGTLNFTASASTSDGAAWITLSATSGTAPSLLSVGVDPTKLPGSGLIAGTFTGQVLLKTGGDLVTIPVTYTVGDSVFRQINPLTFTKAYAGADPLPQVITVTSTGSSFQFFIHAVNSTGGDWLSISSNANDYYNTPNAVTVTVSPDITLAAGTYSAEIIAVSRDGTLGQIIPVTLNVGDASASFFDDLPGQLTFSMLTKGSAPPAQVVPVRNAGSGDARLHCVDEHFRRSGLDYPVGHKRNRALPAQCRDRSYEAAGLRPYRRNFHRPGSAQDGRKPGYYTGHGRGGRVSLPAD